VIRASSPVGLCSRCLLDLGRPRHGSSSAADFPGASDELLTNSQVRHFGDYELLHEIARGGMGVVYRARQISLNRPVALKMILAGELAGRDSLGRFQREAHAAASLHHPNIVPVYEIGEHELQHYFTMRLVPGGRNIADWAVAQRGNWRGIAAAAAKAARAVDHAHTRGVLHRDLKPSNILWDDEAGPQVTDFGLAKLLDETDPALTRTVHAIGTPSYMAPEQMGAKEVEITTATDVYGLGAVLYELLSGKPPFSGPSALETMRRAAEETPASLPGVPKDLHTVCLKCLAKAPDDRYPSAAALAEDLERFSRGEPVSAVPLTTVQATWRWARRQPRLAALIVLCAVSLLAGIAGITWQWQKAERARHGERAALQRATSTVIDLYVRSGLTAAKDGELTRAALWFAKAAEASTEPAREKENLARHAAWRAESHTAVRAFKSDIGPILRLSWNRAQTALLGLTWDLQGAIWDVASETRWRPDLVIENAVWAHEAAWFVSSSNGWVQFTEYPSGREVARTPCRGRTPSLAVSPDDRWVAVGGEAPFLWEVSTGRRSPLPATIATPRFLEFSRDGQWVMVGSTNRVGICSSAEPDKFLYPPAAYAAPVTPGFLNADHFYTAVESHKISVLETRTGAQIESYTNTTDKGESFARYGSPDGRYIVTSMAPVIARPSGFAQFPTHDNRIEQADFSRDGSLLATACYDSIVRLVALPGGGPARKIGWHQAGAAGVAISPDKRFIASSQFGGDLVRVWRIGGPPAARNIPVAGSTSFRLSRDGRLLLPTGTTRGYTLLERTRVYSIETTAPAGPEIVPGAAIMDGDFSPDGSWVVLVCSGVTNRSNEFFEHSGGSGTLEFWDYRSGERLGAPVPLPAEPRGVCVHPSGRWVATYTAKRELLEIEVPTRHVRVLHATTNSHNATDVYPNGRCRYSPDGRLLAAWAMRKPPVLWDRETERLVPAQPGGPTQVTDVDFSGGIMSSVSVESRLDFLALPAGQVVRPSMHDSDWLFLGRFSPDGELFLTGGRGKIAHIWDWRRGALRSPALRHEFEVFAGTFIPGTECVATGGLEEAIRFWDLRTGLPMRPPLATDTWVLDLAATPDGRTLIRGNLNGGHIALYDVAGLLPQTGLSVADTLLLAEIDAAAEIRNGGLEPISAPEWLKKWQQFRARRPAWHRLPL
jgi:WD40 repeat protein